MAGDEVEVGPVFSSVGNRISTTRSLAAANPARTGFGIKPTMCSASSLR
jgi:hypothetical protein